MPGDNSEGGIASARLRDALTDGDPELTHELDRHAGLVADRDLSDVLSLLEDAADQADVPDRVEDTKLWQQLVRPNATHRATEATDSATASYLTGSNQEQSDEPPSRWGFQFQKIIRADGRIIVFGGGTNTGKTNVAGLLVEAAKYQFGSDLIIGTNIESLAESADADLICNLTGFRGWTEKDGPKLFIGDEMSSHMKAGSADGHEVVEKMGPLMRFAAKRSLRFVSLGHRPTDLHPDVRKMPGMRYFECDRLENDLGEPTRYRLTVYESIEDDGYGVNELYHLDHVPETRLDYDPDEETGWSWT